MTANGLSLPEASLHLPLASAAHAAARSCRLRCAGWARAGRRRGVLALDVGIDVVPGEVDPAGQSSAPDRPNAL